MFSIKITVPSWVSYTLIGGAIAATVVAISKR